MALVGILRELRTRFGADRLQPLVGSWGPVIAGVCAGRVDRTEWYPYEALVELLRGCDRSFGDGSGALCSDLGRSAGERDLSGAFSILRLLGSPQRLIGSCGRVWDRYYRNAGYMEAIAVDPERTVLRIHNFPAMAPEHCRMMEGWMISAMNTIGVHVLPGAHESECTSRGGAYHEFTCRWTR